MVVIVHIIQDRIKSKIKVPSTCPPPQTLQMLFEKPQYHPVIKPPFSFQCFPVPVQVSVTDAPSLSMFPIVPVQTWPRAFKPCRKGHLPEPVSSLYVSNRLPARPELFPAISISMADNQTPLCGPPSPQVSINHTNNPIYLAATSCLWHLSVWTARLRPPRGPRHS